MVKRKNNKKRMILTIIAVIIISMLTITAKSSRTSYTERQTEEIYINRGETLWTLGRKYCSENEDVRDWISAVKQLNGMKSGTVYAGQTITVYTGG